MFERPSTFSRFAVAYSCSFVRFEPLDPLDLARLVVREAVLLARELLLRAVVFARELPVLAASRVPPVAFRVVPLAALPVVPVAAFRVPPAAFRVVPEALAVPLLAAFFARAVPLLAVLRVAFGADLVDPDELFERERARLAEELPRRAEVR